MTYIQKPQKPQIPPGLTKPAEVAPPAGLQLSQGKRVYFALQALQFMRWGKAESERKNSVMRISNKIEDPDKRFEYQCRYLPGMRLMDTDFTAHTDRMYTDALDIIIKKFGIETFEQAAIKLIKNHLDNLHFCDVCGAHSDIQPPQVKDEMTIAAEVIDNTYPLIDDMRRYGYRVNARSIFGDPVFWSHLRGTHPEVFQKLVSYIEGIEPYENIDIYGSTGPFITRIIDPMEIIARHFYPALIEMKKGSPGSNTSYPGLSPDVRNLLRAAMRPPD